MNRGLPVLLTVTILSGIVLSSSIVSADDDSVVDEINITVPVSCTISGIGMNTHNAEINNGQYDSAIGETVMKAYCNDNEGFAIYAIGYTDNEEGNNVLTNSTLGSDYDITTGTTTSGNNSNWAMKLSTTISPAPTYPIIIAGATGDTLKEQGDPDFTSFQAVPDDYTKVAYRTANTDTGTNAEGSTIKTTYQAYISETQPAGTYTGQVKYTLVYPNDAATPQIPSVSFEDAFLNAGKNKFNNYYKMQDMTSLICDAVTLYDEASKIQLIDARDNKIYWITKLRDDHCWMTQNLDYDLTWGDTLASDTTDIGWNPSTNSYDSSSVAVDEITYTEPGDLVWDGVIGSDNTTSANQITDIDEFHNHIGNYYSWDSAVASNDPSIYEESEESPDQSICPAYWTLPSLANYEQLFIVYYHEALVRDWDKLIEIIDSPIHLIPSYTDDSYYVEIGEEGFYWTNTVYGVSEYSYAINLGLYSDQSDGFLGGFDANRYYRGNVRCVAR